MQSEQPILVVEDSDDDLILLKHAWKKARITIPLIHQWDGLKAIEYLTQAGMPHAPQQLPKLVLTDLKMPGGSGFELLQFMQREPQLQNLVSIVWSSSSQPEDMRKAYALGARCYLPKPLGDRGWGIFVQRIVEFYTLDPSRIQGLVESGDKQNGKYRSESM